MTARKSPPPLATPDTGGSWIRTADGQLIPDPSAQPVPEAAPEVAPEAVTETPPDSAARRRQTPSKKEA